MKPDIDTEHLVPLVSERSVMWDKYLEEYKSRSSPLQTRGDRFALNCILTLIICQARSSVSMVTHFSDELIAIVCSRVNWDRFACLCAEDDPPAMKVRKTFSRACEWIGGRSFSPRRLKGPLLLLSVTICLRPQWYEVYECLCLNSRSAYNSNLYYLDWTKKKYIVIVSTPWRQPMMTNIDQYYSIN